MMEKKTRSIALRLSYDGSAYHGWQRQKNASSVSETLLRAIETICGHQIKLTGCGRTDAGVHALRYCANFRTAGAIPVTCMPLAFNSLLPADISVGAACEAPEDFCAIRSCIKKEYVYRILNTRVRDPFFRDRACFFPAPLDMARFCRAAAAFVGTHDFKAMRSAGSAAKTTVRTVYHCESERLGDMIELRICADGFLYNMARTIAGTVVYAALGKIDPGDIPFLLDRGDRRLAGPTMPAQGLYLSRLWYHGTVGEMMEWE